MKKDKTTSEANRREFLVGGALMGVGAVALGTGCGDDDPEGGGGGGGGGGGTPCEEIPFTNPDQDASEIRWGMLIDLSICKGCFACAVSCKTESDVRLGVFRSQVVIGESGTYPNTKQQAIPWMCNHCAEPSCLQRCPTTPEMASLETPNGDVVDYWARATYQRPDGLVLVNQDACVGCGFCVEDCPYGARFLDGSKAAGGDPTEFGLTIADPHPVDKCDMCIHRLENGVVPSCVNTCPATARIVGNLNDSTSEISQAIAAAGARVSTLLASSGTEPQVFYIDLDEDIYNSGRDIRDESLLQYETPGA